MPMYDLKRNPESYPPRFCKVMDDVVLEMLRVNDKSEAAGGTRWRYSVEHTIAIRPAYKAILREQYRWRCFRACVRAHPTHRFGEVEKICQVRTRIVRGDEGDWILIAEFYDLSAEIQAIEGASISEGGKFNVGIS